MTASLPQPLSAVRCPGADLGVHSRWLRRWLVSTCKRAGNRPFGLQSGMGRLGAIEGGCIAGVVASRTLINPANAIDRFPPMSQAVAVAPWCDIWHGPAANRAGDQVIRRAGAACDACDPPRTDSAMVGQS
jgi:hypothetical protein